MRSAKGACPRVSVFLFGAITPGMALRYRVDAAGGPGGAAEEAAEGEVAAAEEAPFAEGGDAVLAAAGAELATTDQ